MTSCTVTRILKHSLPFSVSVSIFRVHFHFPFPAFPYTLHAWLILKTHGIDNHSSTSGYLQMASVYSVTPEIKEK